MALIDINTASFDELAIVDGDRQVLAAAIVKHRDTHGPFLTVDGLVEVEGISARVLVKILRPTDREHGSRPDPRRGARARRQLPRRTSAVTPST